MAYAASSAVFSAYEGVSAAASRVQETADKVCAAEWRANGTCTATGNWSAYSAEVASYSAATAAVVPGTVICWLGAVQIFDCKEAPSGTCLLDFTHAMPFARPPECAQHDLYVWMDFLSRGDGGAGCRKSDECYFSLDCTHNPS